MRNRGVEIYIVGPEETFKSTLTETVPALDMSAMLTSTGLLARYQKLFVAAHDKMCSFIQSKFRGSKLTILYFLIQTPAQKMLFFC